jgi:hypothetical protein
MLFEIPDDRPRELGFSIAFAAPLGNCSATRQESREM